MQSVLNATALGLCESGPDVATGASIVWERAATLPVPVPACLNSVLELLIYREGSPVLDRFVVGLGRVSVPTAELTRNGQRTMLCVHRGDTHHFSTHAVTISRDLPKRPGCFWAPWTLDERLKGLIGSV